MKREKAVAFSLFINIHFMLFCYDNIIKYAICLLS